METRETWKVFHLYGSASPGANSSTQAKERLLFRGLVGVYVLRRSNQPNKTSRKPKTQFPYCLSTGSYQPKTKEISRTKNKIKRVNEKDMLPGLLAQ